MPKVEIDFDGRRRTVEAQILGPLAITPAVRGQGWTITHIASGMAVGTPFPSEHVAAAACGALLTLTLPIDWYSETPVTTDAAAQRVLGVLQKIREVLL